MYFCLLWFDKCLVWFDKQLSVFHMLWFQHIKYDNVILDGLFTPCDQCAMDIIFQCCLSVIFYLFYLFRTTVNHKMWRVKSLVPLLIQNSNVGCITDVCWQKKTESSDSSLPISGFCLPNNKVRGLAGYLVTCTWYVRFFQSCFLSA